MLVNYSHHTPGVGNDALWIQWLNHCDALIEFNGKVDVEWVVKKLLRMEQWMGAPCNLDCVPYSNDERL